MSNNNNNKKNEPVSVWDILLLLRATVIGCITHSSLQDLQAAAHLAAGPAFLLVSPLSTTGTTPFCHLSHLYSTKWHCKL